METPEWCLAVLLGSWRKILFNVSTITFPGVIYSGMLMCLESTGPCGLWHGFLWAFLSSIRSGTAQALWCRCHLFKQQRLMLQESIDDPAVRQRAQAICLCLSAFTQRASLFMSCFNLTLQYALWKLMLQAFHWKLMNFLVCLSHTVNTVFMCLLSPRICALCHGLNKHDTITGCKWASPYIWDPLLFHTHLISL